MADLTLMIQACFGLGMFIAIGWALGESRQMPDWRVLLGGLGLQLLLALLLFKVPFVREALT